MVKKSTPPRKKRPNRRKYSLINGHRYQKGPHGKLRPVTTPGCQCQSCGRARRYAAAQRKSRSSLVVRVDREEVIARLSALKQAGRKG